jgi:hypothetical protein
MDYCSCGFDRVRSRPARIIKGKKKAAYYPKTRRSPQSLVRRLVSPFFLPAASSYLELLTLAQQAKANPASAEAEATRPGEGYFYAAPRLALHPFPYSFHCLSRAFEWSGGGGGTRRH